MAKKGELYQSDVFGVRYLSLFVCGPMLIFCIVGFFCFPVWAVGAALYFSSSDPIKAARAKSADAPPMTIKSWMRSIAERKAQQPDVEGLSVSEEMRLSWRAEEKRWALLCLRFLAVVSEQSPRLSSALI